MEIKEVKGERIVHIRFPVFSYNVFVIFTSDIVKSRMRLADVIGHCRIDTDENAIGLHAHNETSPISIIFLKKDSSCGTITHECYHALCAMFTYAGAMVEEEVMAYHLSYIIDQIIKK